MDTCTRIPLAVTLRGGRLAWTVRALSTVGLAVAADPSRTAEVAARGAAVMPFDLRATTHLFTKTADGGTQRMVAKDATDGVQVRRACERLRALQEQFSRGDHSAPMQIHGSAMPGLEALRSARSGRLTITCRDVDGGAQLRYRASGSALVAAVRDWFDAQLSNHGADAMPGHAGHHHAERSSP